MFLKTTEILNNSLFTTSNFLLILRPNKRKPQENRSAFSVLAFLPQIPDTISAFTMSQQPGSANHLPPSKSLAASMFMYTSASFSHFPARLVKFDLCWPNADSVTGTFTASFAQVI